MNACEKQFVAYQLDKTIRLDRRFYLIGASLKDLGKKCFGLATWTRERFDG